MVKTVWFYADESMLVETTVCQTWHVFLRHTVYCAQRVQNTATASNLNQSDPGFESGFPD